jgi:hypothetical protein
MGLDLAQPLARVGSPQLDQTGHAQGQDGEDWS